MDVFDAREREGRMERLGALTSPEDALAYYQSLFWAATDAILVADEHGRYLDANGAATALLGYSRAELLRLGVADVSAPGAGWAEAEYARFLREGTWSGELELRRRDGTTVPVEAHASVVRRRAGGAVYLSVLRDISARRAAERAQQEFLAMLAHELKTPLTVMLANTQLMQRRAAYSEERAATILSEGRRLQRLLDDLRDVAHAASAPPALRPAPLDLPALVAEAAEQAIAALPAHPVRVERPAGPLVGAWDADRVRQVVQNLLSNAGKYAPEGSEIRVRVEARGDGALVAVADRGPGIPPEELPRLFDRFYRTAAAAASGAPGLGLGLHICRLLVEAHGGRIWVESAPGEGTTVSFTLPFAPPPAA